MLFGRRCRRGNGGRLGNAAHVGGGERGCEVLCGDAVDGYITEGLDVGGGYAHAGCAGAVDGGVGIVRGGGSLRGILVLGVGMGLGMLEAKGVGKGVRGREVVVCGCAGAVWDKEAAHGARPTGDDDGVGVGAGRGAGAGDVGGDGVGTAVATGGPGRADGRCAGP